MERTLVPDWMHCLSLGVFQWFISAVLYELFEQNAFRRGGGYGGQDAIIQGSCIQIRSELFDWYGSEAAAGRTVNTVQDFSASMFNGPGLDLGLHAAETNSFLEFVVNVLLVRYHASLSPAVFTVLTGVGSALVSILKLIRRHRWTFPADAVQVRGAEIFRTPALTNVHPFNPSVPAPPPKG